MRSSTSSGVTGPAAGGPEGPATAGGLEGPVAAGNPEGPAAAGDHEGPTLDLKWTCPAPQKILPLLFSINLASPGSTPKTRMESPLGNREMCHR